MGGDNRIGWHNLGGILWLAYAIWAGSSDWLTQFGRDHFIGWHNLGGTPSNCLTQFGRDNPIGWHNLGSIIWLADKRGGGRSYDWLTQFVLMTLISLEAIILFAGHKIAVNFQEKRNFLIGSSPENKEIFSQAKCQTVFNLYKKTIFPSAECGKVSISLKRRLVHWLNVKQLSVSTQKEGIISSAEV